MWARLSIAAPAVAVLQMANAQCALAQTHPNVGGNVGINPAGPEPRFIIRVIEFFVADETGFDFWGSDDFFIVVDTQRYDLATRFRVDSGNWYSVPPAQQCIMPAIDPDDAPNDIWTCLPAGTAAPIVFNISGWDRGGPHWFAPPLSVPQTDSDVLDVDGTQSLKTTSTRIGRHRVDLSLATLLEKTPRVGDKWPFTVSFVAGCSSPGPCFGDEPWYDLNLEVTRVSDESNPVPLNPNP